MNRTNSLPTIPVSPAAKLRLNPLDFQKQGKFSQSLRDQIKALKVDTFITGHIPAAQKSQIPSGSADISALDLMSKVTQLQELSNPGAALQSDKFAALERRIEEVAEKQRSDTEQLQALLQESIARALEDVPRKCQDTVAHFCREHIISTGSSQVASVAETLESNQVEHQKHHAASDIEQVWAYVKEQEDQLRNLEVNMQEQIHAIQETALHCLKEQLESIPDLIGCQIQNVCNGLQNIQSLESQKLVDSTRKDMNSLRDELSENLRKVQQQGAAFQRSQMEEIQVARRMAEIVVDRADEFEAKLAEVAHSVQYVDQRVSGMVSLEISEAQVSEKRPGCHDL
eukprot:gnl/MRDRNA2_/MRDRNA2_116999_c0_seq1.p1 gnl/MRDRNA2_/MRDRNA2_116999_c0~~gnl/MRDRNA2_/MRDRNA2_116999_c0_seq1.p1  ORF type:complete len:342 (-),score=71.08 gnl/MRDRNA2_/MRDRNA2_116999_c0_seq1:64-1089(-)